MKLPQDAYIAPEKLTRYLLIKRPIGDKSEFLKRAGYTIDNWERLEQDIRRQILLNDAVSIERTDYGEYFEIRTSLTGPNGIALRLRTVWMREAQSGITKFITLYPDKGRTT
ncbi:MAG: hypothetical protein HY204_00615 [Nitrospirae bacterium]|nr:hypothetical protein [Nitrospirota bacterium]